MERAGGLMYYDPDADLTWVTALGGAGDLGAAQSYVGTLDILGITNWRLPTSDSCTGTNCSDSELGNMFYNVLGNSAGSLTNSGPFSLLDDDYWSGTELVGFGLYYYFDIPSGNQATGQTDKNRIAWAVQSGDVAAVPIPAAAWLFGSSLLGLIVVKRRKA